MKEERKNVMRPRRGSVEADSIFIYNKPFLTRYDDA